jgi:pimeloyl-ACP methyl ester carboxylesterase
VNAGHRHRPGSTSRADAAASRGYVEIPGGRLYYQTQGRGPALVVLGGGPANADTPGPLASHLADDYTVITYDRRGYSRSRLDDPGEETAISRHSDDLRLLIAALGTGPAAVFGTSFGALIALDLAASAPGSTAAVIVHEPPLGQLVPDAQRGQFHVGAHGDPSAALDVMAAATGVTRARAAGRADGGPETSHSDISLFIRRDVPAIGAYRLDLPRLAAVSGRLTVTASQAGRDHYPYQCALRLAEHLGTLLVELPGNHAGMIRQPAQFAAALKTVLTAGQAA